MARTSLGARVGVCSVDEVAALARDAAESAGQRRIEPVRPHLIDGEHEDEPRSHGIGGARKVCSAGSEEAGQEDEQDALEASAPAAA